jgi:hypothetical protein
MSTGDQVASVSAANFNKIFQAACDDYKSLTGFDLNRHPFATELGDCNSPDSIMVILRRQSETFVKRRRKHERLVSILEPTVNILFAFSSTLGEGVGLVSILSLLRSCA